MSAAPRPARSAVVITATEPEPRTFGKQVVLGGILDHLCDRLGADRVHVVLIGRPDAARPATPYSMTLIQKPSAREQLGSVLTRVTTGRSSLQEAALWSTRVRDELARVIADLQPDLEIWDTMRAGQFAASMPRRPRVLYADDLFSKRYASMLDLVRREKTRIDNPLGEFSKLLPAAAAGIASRPIVYLPLLRMEQRLAARSERTAPRDFDTTVLVNDDEAAELRTKAPGHDIRTLLPLLPPPAPRDRAYDGRPRFAFVGSLDFAPNRDALTWFLRECQGIRTALPGFELLLVGRGSDRPLPEAAAWDGSVRGLGWVDDLDGALASVAGLLSPIRVGSGTKIKALEALARGLPIVATPEGVLGLSVGVDDGCLVGSTPADLIRALVEAADPQRNAELSEASARAWRSRFSPEVVAPSYDEVFSLERTAIPPHLADGRRA